MKRFVGIDIIKVFAILFVTSVHFFLNTNFYYTKLTGNEMLFLQMCMRWTFLICVPLFIISTGYLQSNKQISIKYYKGILNVFGVYLFYSIVSIVIRVFYFKEHQSAIGWVYNILSFKADGYSWYVNMFLGLFLLIPFLNLIFNNLKSKKECQILILILVVLTGLAGTLNGIPINSDKSITFYFPDWWVSLYPLLYYFIGCYIKKYKPIINKFLLFICFCVLVLIESILTFYFSKGGNFVPAIGEYNSLFVITSSILFFLFFYNIDIQNNKISSILAGVSSITLDIYLCSYITDIIIYNYVMKHIYTDNFTIVFYFIPIVGSTFAISTFIGFTRQFLANRIKKLVIHKIN